MNFIFLSMQQLFTHPSAPWHQCVEIDSSPYMLRDFMNLNGDGKTGEAFSFRA